MPTVLALFQLSQLAIALLQDDTTDFGDLGRKLLGGFALAVVLAVVFTLIKLRLRDRKPPAKFISVTALPEQDRSRNATE